MNEQTRTRLRDAWILIRGPAITVVIYLLLRALFEQVTERQGGVSPSYGVGLLTPDGGVSPGIVMLGLTVIAMRIVVLFVLPAWLVYRVLVRLLGRGHAST